MATAEMRKLAAIMFTDIVGFSRQMGSNEARTLRLLEIHDQLIRQTVAEYKGKVIKTIGDAFLVDFPSVVHAVQCAQQIQAQFRVHNTDKEKTEQIHVRIGIHLGDIVQRDGDVFGDGVNIASRLQGLAEPDTICLSDVVYRDVANKVPLDAVVSLGRPKLKNIAQRFQVYALLPEPPQGLWQTLWLQRLKLSRRVGTVVSVLVFVSVLLLVGIVLLRYSSLSPLSTHHSSRITQEAQPPLLPLPDKPSIAVLPFVNMSEDPKQDYLGDGIAEDITTELTKLSGLFVISRYSAFTYKGKEVKVQEVSRELGVRYVLEGSVRRANDEVRVTAQLIDATTGYHLWSERYSRSLRDIFALQDEIVRKIVVHLALRLTDIELEQLERAYPVNIEAYEYQHRGIEHWFRLTKDDNAQARQLCEKAIELEPTYAPAYSCTGYTYWAEWAFQWTQDPETLERALELGQKAIALDDSLPTAHDLVGVTYLWKRRYEQAIAEIERAIVLAPNWGSPYAALGISLNATGRAAEAIGVLEKAIRLNPRHPLFTANYLTVLGGAYRLTGQYDEAITTLKKALGLFPKLLGAHQHLAVIYVELGRDAEARAEVAEVVRISPNYSLEVMRQTWPYKDPAALERYYLAPLRKAGLK
jgi:adenylate cyclase